MTFAKASELLGHADKQGMRRVLIVTALPLEMTAVRAPLKHLGSVRARDGNFLEIEQFSASGQEWFVVVGESGAGNHASQSLVTTALQQFGPFEFMMFIGVAASRKKADAPIGSVLASNHVYLADVGKYEGGGFSARPRVLQSDNYLVTLAKKVARDKRWQERITPPYAGTSPGDTNYPTPFPPAAIICPIVSVESVSADPNSTLEQHIAKNYQDATGLEMEGYGALFAAHNERTPCIVIRGVSDMREQKTPEIDKIHQPVAAGHATAFGLELLDMWSQNYPAPQRTGGPLVSLAVSPVQATDTPPEAPKRITMVLSFPGEAADYPVSRQNQILGVLRETTGDSGIEIVGTASGSFHMLVNIREGDRERLAGPDLQQKLLNSLQVELLGTMTEPEFRSIPTAKAALFTASLPLLSWTQTLPGGTSFERPELQQLLSLRDNAEGSTTALLGSPGSGKTALLATFAHALQLAEINFLAIKADFLDPTITGEEELKNFLNLPDLPSAMLAKLSAAQPVFLIIDQLDALAGYVDLRTGRLSVLLNLVRLLGSRRNIHVVLSARTFEFEHDTRLRSVRAESLQLELPGWSSVLTVLEASGVKAEGWPADAQEVMRSPQALATFLKLSKKATTAPFSTYQAMLEELWQERILVLPNGGAIAKLVGTIAEDMAEKETLWIASARYEAQAAQIKSLVASGILIYPNTAGSLGFSHQTVFEYALARSFAQHEGHLSSYVLARESSLFVRPKLWSALTYLRVVEPPTYEIEIRTIWESPNLRLHLRHLLIEFLGQQPIPTEAEAEIFLGALASSDRQTALQAMVDSPGWFSRLKKTTVAQAMSTHGEESVAIGILSRACSFAPEDVIALMTSHWLPNKGFDWCSWHVLQECRNWSEQHMDLANRIIRRTKIEPFTFDNLLSTVGAEQPVVAMNLALTRLQKQLSEAAEEAERRASLPLPVDDNKRLTSYYLQSPSEPLTKLVEQSNGWDGLEALARIDPINFLSIIWPWFRELLGYLRRYEKRESDRGFPLNHVLDLRFEGEGTLGLPEYALLGALRTATEVLAGQEGEGFLEWLKTVEHEDAEPAQRLFAHALTTQAERYAARSLEFLLFDKRRLCLGHIEDYSETTILLVRAASPFWTDDQLQRFVSEIGAYSPRPATWRNAESRRFFFQDLDRLKLELFDELPEDQLSDETRKYIRDGHRRFGDRKRGVTFSGATWIGSPMSTEEMSLASDEDTINAFRELPDSTGWDNPKAWMKGGNIQLSRAFADFAKTDPVRAAQIIEKFQADIGTRAAGYALDAMAEEADPALILDLVSRLESRGFSGEEYRGSVSRAIERLLRRKVVIDDTILATLTTWLSDGRGTASPDEDDVSSDESDSDNEDENSLDDVSAEKAKEREGSVLWGMGGMSILPHGHFPILEVVTRMLLQRRDYDALLRLLSAHLDRSEDEKVWGALLPFIRYISPEDKAPLVDFLSRLFKKYPGLSTTRETAIFLAHMHWAVPGFVRQVLGQWKSSAAPLVQQSFGELATLIWLVQPNLEWPSQLVEEIMNQDIPHARTGAAYASINVWSIADHRVRASELLTRIVKTGENESWAAVIDLFRLVDDITPDASWVALLEAIADWIPLHGSFPSAFVVERLQTLLPNEAELVARLARALAAKWREELADMRTAAVAIAPELVDIAITLHRLGPRTREAGTALFEDLLHLNAYTARETLNEIDNRFRASSPSRRRRLPRRSRPTRSGKRQVS